MKQLRIISTKDMCLLTQQIQTPSARSLQLWSRWTEVLVVVNSDLIRGGLQ